MKKALCKKDFCISDRLFNIKAGNYYKYDIIYKKVKFHFSKSVIFEYRDVLGDDDCKDRLSADVFNDHFYSEKEIRKMKLKKILK